MNQVVLRSIFCPYCGEAIDVLIDCSVEEQSYIEDCQVCCCPIEFHVRVPIEAEPVVLVKGGNE